jgi:hypothetical protein
MLGSDLDARLFTDLESLQPNALVTPNDRFSSARLSPSQSPATSIWPAWLISRTLSVRQVEAMAVPSGMHLIECAGNTDAAAFGLISGAAWTAFLSRR